MNYIILVALAGMVFAGVADYLLKKGINEGINPTVLFFYSFTVVTVLFGTWFFVKSPAVKIDRPLLYYSLIIGILIFIASFALVSALKIGEASIVIPIARMGFVIAVVCAFTFLSEKFTITKGLGILFAVFAILLLSKK